MAALVRAELRAAVVEAISSTVSEPEDTSHLTARELAERLRVHVETIRRWSRQPGFPVRRIGPHAVRFDLVEVRAWRRTAR
ncbi:MAG: helix-turn-helix domain-containing protein [Myxococcales bacterium]|nr:helix-turn-helix domain-containing protein [Myxococcales bacterium]